MKIDRLDLYFLLEGLFCNCKNNNDIDDVVGIILETICDIKQERGYYEF